jgi:hypothetical protein
MFSKPAILGSRIRPYFIYAGLAFSQSRLMAVDCMLLGGGKKLPSVAGLYPKELESTTAM